MKKNHLAWLSSASLLLAAVLITGGLFYDRNAEVAPTGINAILNGDSPHKEVKGASPRTVFKDIQQSVTTSNFDAEVAKAVVKKLVQAKNDRGVSRPPALEDDKANELMQLKNRFGSSGVSNMKFNQAGEVRAIYDSISTGSFDHKNIDTLGYEVRAIAESHRSLFGLGANGAITGAKVSCANDICATRLTKSFNGLPAWDHELTVSSKEGTIFAVKGAFHEPRLSGPGVYSSDQSAFKAAIGQYFSVQSNSVQLTNTPELGIAKLGAVDYYAYLLRGVLVQGAPYDIFVDAETGNVASTLSQVVESVAASGTALDGSNVDFQATQSGANFHMKDPRFPLGYSTSVLSWNANSPVIIQSSSSTSGWPASAVSALKFTEDSVNYFKENHQFDAVNTKGASLTIVVDLNRENASYNSYSNEMTLGVGEGSIGKEGLSFAASNDVVGHEITHGIVASTSGLLYQYQSGALNESFSDFFGSMIDGDDWLLGEDLLSPAGKALRSMVNPSDALSSQPSHFSDYYSLPNTKSGDWGGVHIFSGIPNRALYLLAEGLTAEGLGTSIGREKAANLAFKTMIGLTTRASFDEAAEYMASLAQVEYPDDASIYDATVLAWKSVGLPQEASERSSISSAGVTAKDVTAVAYLKPYYSTSSVSPSENKYTVYVQGFLNSNPEFSADANDFISTGGYAKFTRPLLFNLADDQVGVLYQRKVSNSYYLWQGSDYAEIKISDGSTIAGIDYSQDSELFAVSGLNTNEIAILSLDLGTAVLHEISIPSTDPNAEVKPVTFIDAVRFDPTGRFVVFDFFLCAVGETNCQNFQNGNWSIGILDVASGSVEFPFPSQPARYDVGFPAFSNTTDRYIAIDVVEYPEDSDALSAIAIYDRTTAELNYISGTDGTTDKLGAFGYPSFSADDTSLVHSVKFDDYEGMFVALLEDYKLKDPEATSVLLNPNVSFKAYAAALPGASNIPSLKFTSSSLNFGDVIKPSNKSVQLCLKNDSVFPIDLYDSTLDTGFSWNGDNQVISGGESVCSPIVAEGASLELGEFSKTFSIIHNGANSPTPVSLSGIVDFDTDSDGIVNNIDTDDDGDGVADDSDAFPLDASETVDTDSDGIGNNADTDDDGDGVADDSDAFPLDASESVDTDSDGIGNNADTDDDGDGVADDSDAFSLDASESVDTDSDGIGNNADTDDDGDGVADDSDAFSLDASESVDTDSDGIGNNADTDDDGDGVADDSDAFPLDASESVDTDSDGVGDNADAFPSNASYTSDSDDDGMPDAWEVEFGLDSTEEIYSSAGDFDGDGITNLDEFINQTNPIKDELPPELTIPDDIIVTAVGRLTTVDFGAATAEDNKDGVLTPAVSDMGPFTSGKFELSWTVSDAAGNESMAVQLLSVLPLANLKPSAFVIEGSTVQVAAILSGFAPEYPVTIPISIDGTAELDSDFSQSAPEIVIQQGKSGFLELAILDDSVADGDETIVISLGDPTNAAVGSVPQMTLTISEGNVAPQIGLSVSQEAEKRRTVYSDGGVVTVTATYSDLNSADSQILSWDTGDWTQVDESAPVFDISGSEVSFDATGLAEMTFPISATVTDDGNPILASSKTVLVKVIDTKPVLDQTTDSDGDGLSDAVEGLADTDGDGIADYLDYIEESYFAPIGSSAQGLMQSPVGTTILLGASSFEAGTNSVGISEEVLSGFVGSSDENYDYPRGLFDFTVSGAKPGNSYHLAFPLSIPIPQGAVYRKYINSNVGWQDFVVDAGNAVSSALVNGVGCPEPGSDLYVSGLKTGDNCIGLLIEDGGPNDIDNSADGIVTDPGGLAVLYFGPPSSNSAIALSASEIDANGTDTLSATITAVDSGGRLLDGLSITAEASLSDISISDFTPEGNGIYVATVTAGKTSGDATITVNLDDGSASVVIESSSIKLVTPAPAPTPVSPSTSGGGGCTVGQPGNSDSTFPVLLLGMGLLMLRRRLDFSL